MGLAFIGLALSPIRFGNVTALPGTAMPLIAAPARQIACARCGTVFECAQAGECWCAAEPFRLPMPDAAGEDCLCPACLRKAALSPDAAQHEP